MTAGWCARTSRAAVFAAVCVLLAALAHELMSGGRVPGWALAAGAAATGAAGWCLAGRERGPALIVPVVVGAQAVLHSAFSYARSATPDSGGHATASMGAMDMSGGHSTASMGGMHMDHPAGGSPSLGMLAAHLLAALLCGLWLAHGERAAFRVLRAVGARLAAPLRLPLAPPPTPHHPLPRFGRPRSDRAPRLLLLVHAITSRGPPVGTAVA